MTTILDPATAAIQSLGALYKMRWNIEVDFRVIKATLEMDVLRCKTAPMVNKEISVYFLAYNLVAAIVPRRMQQNKIVIV